jgi:hypothetical protein
MKVTIEFDTETKQLSVTENGAVMPDVDSVSFYKNSYYDYDSEQPKETFSMQISQCGAKSGGVTKRISTMAKLLGYQDEN